MVGAGKLPGVAVLCDAELRAAMGTAVDKDLHGPVRVTHHHHRGIAEALGFEVAWAGRLALQARPSARYPPGKCVLVHTHTRLGP